MQRRAARSGRATFCTILIVLIVAVSFLVSTGALTDAAAKGKPDSELPWWEVTPEPEVPSTHYDSILYSEIAPKLREIQLNSDKLIEVEVIGQSAGGRNLFLVTIARRGDSGRFGHYKNLRKLMLRDPDKALAMIDRFDDFKVPFFINGSIHGDEYPGTDACMRLIEQLAYEDSPEVDAVLDNVVLLINVVQNPDGRVMGIRQNANGFDVNRDLITQSQPESRATVKVITEWNPMVFLDLHGFVHPMLIEPCTPPHNPNYEYDLYLTWALSLAFAMEEELFAQTDETNTIIPYIDWADGWDDWPPIYAAMYPMLHGSYGHTIETPHRDERGVSADLAVVWGALKFVVENKKAMIRDQIEVYRRGALDLPQVLIPNDLLDETKWEQYNELTTMDFPAAYIIPAASPLQANPVQAAELVDFLIYNDVQVDQAKHAFQVDGTTYPGGTYVVWMNQPKRSVANIILEDGMDVSGLTGITFYSPPASWSHPLLWGVSRTVVVDSVDIDTKSIKRATMPKGTLEDSEAEAYAVVPDTIQAFATINRNIQSGAALYRAAQAFTDGDRTFDAGTVVFAQDISLAMDLKESAMLDVMALSAMPEGLVPMTPQAVAAYGDEGLSHALGQLGFDFTPISRTALNAGMDLSGFDVFIFGSAGSNLSEPGKAAILDFINAGGDYIGIGGNGSAFAVDQELVEATIGEDAGNGVVNIDLLAGHPLSCGFPAVSHAFIYDPVWFTDLGGDAEPVASMAPDTMLVSGYWPEWQTSPALGMPVMLFREDADDPDQDIVLMGFDATFRGHPRNSFKLIGNAIYSGLDLPGE